MSARDLFKNRKAEAQLGHGPFDEMSDTYVDAKPYEAHYSNGMFSGYDGSVWKYYRLPDDVRTEWLLNPEEALTNQSFFVDVCREMGQWLDSQTERVRNDVRRDFHIQVTQTPFEGIIPPPGSTPAQADYLRRVSARYTRPVWHGFFGVKLLPADIFYEAHGFQAKLMRYLESIKNPTSIHWTELRKDLDDVDTLMKAHGLEAVDFIENPQDFEQLTAWHGIEDAQHMLPRQLQNVRMKEPVQALSLITPKWGEIQFHALKPREGMDLSDPADEAARWAVPLYAPSSDVVLINIRGQIRAPKVADNLLDIKKIKRTTRRSPDSNSAIDAITYARAAVDKLALPMLDNLEIIVSTKVPPINKTSRLRQQMKRYNMELVPLIGRQSLGLLASFPTYPRHVLRIPRGNSRRPELSNVMMPGLIAMSGLFRATKPCGPTGIYLGLSDAGDEYREIYTETDAASKYNRVPGMLVTGRPGSGKTQTLLQMAHEMVNQGLPVAFFNPKKDGTLKASFDHMGGVTISMDRKYLEQNPGMLDPMLFLQDRAEVASIIADSIFIANRMYEDRGSESNQRRTKLMNEIKERAEDNRNRSSWDIIFGNDHVDPKYRTEPVTDGAITEFVRNRVNVSPFWRAFISRSSGSTDLRNRITAGRSFLVEWDKSMNLPDISTDPKDYTDPQIDTVISVNVTFKYASTIISGTGGAIIVDESWVLKSSREALSILERGGREWRQANIMLIMATQRIQDWITSKAERNGQASTQNMSTFFDRYLIMAINDGDQNELDAFYDLTKLPRTQRTTHYITHAGVTGTAGSKGNTVARSYYIDRIYGWEGGLIHVWPELELNLGRTDKLGQAARAAQQEVDTTASVSGVLADVVSTNEAWEQELVAEEITSQEPERVPAE